MYEGGEDSEEDSEDSVAFGGGLVLPEGASVVTFGGGLVLPEGTSVVREVAGYDVGLSL